MTSLQAMPVKLTPNGAGFASNPAGNGGNGITITSPAGPGGTISGPTLMTLADTVAYVAVVSIIGPEWLTVTSHLAIDFLRKPPPAGLRGVGEVLKLGRRQAVIAIKISSDADGELVAYSTATYALPSTLSPGVALPPR